MSEFLNMGGYAVYVWSSYGIALVSYSLVYFVPKFAHKRIIKKLKGQYKREQQKKEMSKQL